MEIGIQCELGIECLQKILKEGTQKCSGNASPNGSNIRKCRNRMNCLASNVDSTENLAILSKASKKFHKYKKIKKRFEALQAENKKLIEKLAITDTPRMDFVINNQENVTFSSPNQFPDVEEEDSIALYDIEDIQPLVKSYLARQTKKPTENMPSTKIDTVNIDSHRTVFIKPHMSDGKNILKLENELEDDIVDDIDIINDDDSDDYDDYDYDHEQMQYYKRVIKEETELIIEDTMQVENDLFCCNLCDGLFESINELDVHMRSHDIHMNTTIDLTDTETVQVNNVFIESASQQNPMLKPVTVVKSRLPALATASVKKGSGKKTVKKTEAKSTKKTEAKSVKKPTGTVTTNTKADKKVARKAAVKKALATIPAEVTATITTKTTATSATVLPIQSVKQSATTVVTIKSSELHENKDVHTNQPPHLHSNQTYSGRDRSRSNHRTNSRSRERDSHFDRDTSPLAHERCILFIGDIERDTSRHELFDIFRKYGQIRSITIHNNRFTTENSKPLAYAFVTYENAGDAFRVYDQRAVDFFLKDFNISFGGRRAFCKASYKDLDNTESASSSSLSSYQAHRNKFTFTQQKPCERADESFEMMLKSVKQTLDKRKEINKLIVS